LPTTKVSNTRRASIFTGSTLAIHSKEQQNPLIIQLQDFL